MITVCFNSEKTIKRTIDSVISQSYKNIEYIIIDGGSSDNTIDLAKDLIPNNLRKIISEPDDGIYDAYNKGLELTTGDIIVYLNSDDYFADENALFDVIEIFKIQNYDLVSSGTQLFNSKGSAVRTWFEEGIGNFSVYRQLPQPSLFIKTNVFKDLSLKFDKSYKICADLKLQLQVFKSDKFLIGFTNRVVTKMQIGRC